METTETEISSTNPEQAWGRLNKELLTQKRRKRARRISGAAVEDVYRDRIARAWAREREHRRVLAPERGWTIYHVFECVCCGKTRSDDQRREPFSEVCMKCVREAGYWN